MNISIILPFYEKQESLKRVHDELKLQISPDDQIIVVDDFSPSGVPDLDCPCTKVIRPEKQVPHTYRLNTLRNLGLSSASSDACIILDPDCVPNPNFIKNARRMFDPSVVFGGAIDFVQQDGSTMPDPRQGRVRRSKWVDLNEQYGIGIMIWGGCLFFSRRRTALTGWFDEAFNGNWGTEEHEFASRCYQGGLRLFYSVELQVTHLWHPKATPDKGKNALLWREKVEQHRKMLDRVTGYRPEIGVSVIASFKPDLLERYLRAVFRNIVPVKVRLCVNGDNSPEMEGALRLWEGRWAVEIVKQEKTSVEKIHNDALNWAKNKKYKYLINIDDATVFQNGVINIVKIVESHRATTKNNEVPYKRG